MRVAGVTPSLHRTLILNYYFLFLVRTFFCVLLSFSLKVGEQERRIWLNREIALRTHARAISGGARVYNNLSANLPRPCLAYDEKCKPLRRECTKQCPSSRNMRPWSRTGTAALFESLTQYHTQEVPVPGTSRRSIGSEHSHRRLHSPLLPLAPPAARACMGTEVSLN